MDIATLEALGINKEDLQQRVVDQIVESLLTKTSVDDEDRAYYGESEFSRDLKVLVKTSIDKKVADLAEKFVLPDVEKYIEELTIQTTNQYGEKRGEPITFVEYLVHRAKDYMQEQVDSSGKSKGTDSYSWTGKQTRITYLINSHLHYSIETAMKNSLSIATGEIARGIHETARIKLNEIAANLKVGVTV